MRCYHRSRCRHHRHSQHYLITSKCILVTPMYQRTIVHADAYLWPICHWECRQLNGILCMSVLACACMNYTYVIHTAKWCVFEWEKTAWTTTSKKKIRSIVCISKEKLCKNRRVRVPEYICYRHFVGRLLITALLSDSNNNNNNIIINNCLWITSTYYHFIGMTNLSWTQLFWKIRNTRSLVRWLHTYTLCCRRIRTTTTTKSIGVFLHFSSLD